jgi:putative transposase
VLDRLPQREQAGAKELLREVAYAPSRAEAVKAREAFSKRFKPWYPQAVDVLEDDWDRMVRVLRLPEAHWKHLRTTNVVESPFASVRLRTGAAKRYKKVESATALIWKLLTVAEKRSAGWTHPTCSATCTTAESLWTESPSRHSC